jgi:Flp pilus assembly protein TadD
LIHADSDRHVWAKEFTKEVKDIFTVQGEIAQAIANELGATLTGTEIGLFQKMPTANLDAWDALMKAQASFVRYSFSHEKSEAAYQSTLTQVNQALQLDSNLAQAYVLKARAYWNHHFDREQSAEQIIDTVALLCRKAIDLDDGLADAHVMLGMNFLRKAQPDSALLHLEKAIELDPNHPEAYWQLGRHYLLSQNGQFEKGVQLLWKSLALDPNSIWSSSVMNDLAWAYLGIGDFGKADLLANQVLEREKSSPAAGRAYEILTRSSLVEGDPNDALEFAESWLAIDSAALRYLGEITCQFKKECGKAVWYFQALNEHTPEKPDFKSRLAYALWQTGHQEQARQLFGEEIGRLEAEVRQPGGEKYYYTLAAVHAFLGEKDKAYEYLHLFEEKAGWPWGSCYYVEMDPLFENLWKEKEFRKLVERAKEEKEKMRERLRKWERREGS